MSTAATPRADAVSHSSIAVVGAGLMGHGIAQVFAAAGHPVSVFDPDPAVLATVPERVRAICDLLGRDTAEAERISLHPVLEDAVAEAAFVFEAAPEKLAVKRDAFARLDAACRADAVLASNTSAIPIRDIGSVVKDASRVVGTHFWNPPHLVPLVEVVEAETTAPETVQGTIELLAAAGKSPVHVRRDVPGFIGNRLQHALKREAIALVAAGVCDAETIDTVVKDGFGARMAVLGPLEQSDLVGLDLTLDIHRVLIADLDRTPGPHELLERKVEAGELGMSAGRGFRDWTVAEAAEVRDRLSNFLAEMARRAGRGRDD